MRHFYFYYSLVISIIIIIELFLLCSVKSQNTTLLEERQLLKDCLFFYNKTQSKFNEVIEKMKGVKNNIFLKTKYQNINKTYSKIEIQLTKLQKQLNSSDYNKYVVLEELKVLNLTLAKFDKKCIQVMNLYHRNQKTNKAFKNIIKLFFITLFIIIILVMIIIGVISFYAIKRQIKYYALEEEVTTIEDINKNKNDNYQIDIIKERKMKSNSHRNFITKTKRKYKQEEQKESDNYHIKKSKKNKYRKK